MAQYTNENIVSITTKRTFPELQTTLTGTNTVAANVKFITGTGTTYLSQIGGDGGVGQPATPSALGWLIDLTNSEIRRIDSVVDNTHVVLETGFTNAQVGTTLYYHPISKYQQMGFLCSAGGGSINSVVLPANGFMNFGSDLDSKYSVAPVIVDGSGGTIIAEAVAAGR